MAEPTSEVSVGDSTTAVLAENPNRSFALFINDSDTVIYLNIGGAAVLNDGVRLNPSGGAYEMSRALGNLDTQAVNAISSVASKNLLVVEYP